MFISQMMKQWGKHKLINGNVLAFAQKITNGHLRTQLSELVLTGDFKTRSNVTEAFALLANIFIFSAALSENTNRMSNVKQKEQG